MKSCILEEAMEETAEEAAAKERKQRHKKKPIFWRSHLWCRHIYFFVYTIVLPQALPSVVPL